MKKILIFITLLLFILSTTIVPAEKPEKSKNNLLRNLKLEGLYSSGNSYGNPFSQTKYVPGISFIMDFSYNRISPDISGNSIMNIPGFIPDTNAVGGESSILNGNNGFNLNYGELALFAAVDPYFDLFTALGLGEDSFGIEELYINSRKFPGGFRMKLGKFKSSFGRINSQHAHQWDFMDIPLGYRVFFGKEGLIEKGVQLNWVAPLDFYLAFGVESLQGQNRMSFGTDGFTLSDGNNSGNYKIEGTVLPNLWTFFIKTSFDVGNLVILAGISHATGNSRQNSIEGFEGDAFSGTTKIWGGDLTLKYLIDSYRYISLTSEYIYRDMTGTNYMFDYGNNLFQNNLSKKQAGFYTQIVYRFKKLWRTAARFDFLGKNRIVNNGNSEDYPNDLKRFGFMVDYSPTEFTRIRFQYNFNRYVYIDKTLQKPNELILQFNIAIGAHGAHPF